MTPVPSNPRTAPYTLRPAIVLLLAIAGGTAVANLYLAQPLLYLIAEDLHADIAIAGWLVTATQIGYASGAFLIVPLGDVLNRRRLLVTTMLLTSVGLGACAFAPSFSVLLVAVAVVGLTTVAGQILAPLVADLADDSNRGRVVGTVASGILIGILLSRTASGLVAGFANWRAIFGVAAVLNVILALVLLRAIPNLKPKTSLRYPALLASIFKVVIRERTVRWTLLLGASAFALFSIFWTALTFLLSSPPFSYSVTVVGLFGLVGLAGALAAQRAGRFHDRGWSIPATGAAWLLALVSCVVAGFGGDSVALIVIAILLLDIAIQGSNILNQTRLFSVSPIERSRLNTAFVTCNFLGGAIGSAVASALWTTGGWHGVCIGAVALCVFALSVWFYARRTALVIRPSAG